MTADFFGNEIFVPVFLIWLGIAVIFAVIEGFTQGLTTIWFAGGAVAAAGVSLATDNVLIQIIAALTISGLLLYFTRPWAVKKFNREVVKTNVSAVIGQTGVLQDDLHAGGTGIVRADGKMWTAVLAEGETFAGKDEPVEIAAVEGVKLIVRRKA